MRAPRVAVCALAALAALDLSPKTQPSSESRSTHPNIPDIYDGLAPASAAEAEPGEQMQAIAPPEVSGKHSGSFATATATGMQLNDVHHHWAHPFIAALTADGIIRGFPDRTFRPDAPIETAHFVAMLQRAVEKHGVRFLVSYANDLLSTNQGVSTLATLVAAGRDDRGLATLENRLIQANADRPSGTNAAEIRVTRAEAAAFIYHALAQAGLVAAVPDISPSVAEGVTGTAGIRSDVEPGELVASLPLPVRENFSREPVLVAAASPPKAIAAAQPVAISQELPQAATPPPASAAQPPAVAPAANLPESGQSSVPTVPASLPSSIPSVSSPESLPSPSATVDSAAPAATESTNATNPAEVPSQLGTLATGDRAKNFLDYWTTLCQNNPQALSDALAACDQLLVLKPKDAAIWRIRGNLMQRAGKLNEAVASYDRALSLAPATSELHANRCKALSDLGSQETAIAACEQAIQLDKTWGQTTAATAWYTKGTALKRLGRNQDASTAYERALSLDPKYSLVWAEQCRVQSELGKQEAAIAACDHAIAVNGNWGERSPALAWYNRGVALTRLERYAEAIAAYEHALAINPRDALIWTKQGVLYSKLGKHSEALTSHDQALKVSPNYSLALLNRCTVLNKLGNYDAALAACDLALAGDGRWNELGVASVWDQRSVALAGLNRLEEALGSADRAVTIKPDFAETWSNRAVTLWRMKQPLEALASADRAVALKPNYSQAWFNKGRILRTLERFDAAIAAYDQALKGDVNPTDKPTLADIWANRSAALWKSGQYEMALESANKAVETDPKSALGWFNRGGILMALQKPQEAAIAYQQATQLDPTYVYAWTGQGMALERSGKYQEALAALDAALKLDPNQSLAQESRETVMKKLEPPKPASPTRKLGTNEAAL